MEGCHSKCIKVVTLLVPCVCDLTFTSLWKKVLLCQNSKEKSRKFPGCFPLTTQKTCFKKTQLPHWLFLSCESFCVVKFVNLPEVRISQVFWGKGQIWWCNMVDQPIWIYVKNHIFSWLFCVNPCVICSFRFSVQMTSVNLGKSWYKTQLIGVAPAVTHR